MGIDIGTSQISDRPTVAIFDRPSQSQPYKAKDLLMEKKTVETQEVLVASSRKIMPAVVALLFGAFLVIGVGFAHSDTVHNAAHDTRHSFAFPCH